MGNKNQTSKSREKTVSRKDPDTGSSIPGWPGYRTRQGRSGYDPIDSRTEAAHTVGTLIQRLFTGEVRNPLHMVLLGLFGLALTGPLMLAISEALEGHSLPWNAWLFLLPMGAAGIAILVNLIRNLIRRLLR